MAADPYAETSGESEQVDDRPTILTPGLFSVILLGLLLLSGLSCGLRKPPVLPMASRTPVRGLDQAGVDETTFWERLPRPEDAEILPAAEGIDLGFATGMIEPELFDFYAAWLSEQGWKWQAPVEAMVMLPHQVWRKDGAELLIEIRRLDGQERTIVWIQLEEQ